MKPLSKREIVYKDKKICVVVPAYNEGSQIAGVIETMPDYVDAMLAPWSCRAWTR